MNPVSAKITTEALTDFNKQTDVDKKDSDAVAKAWLEDNDLIPATKPAAKTGPKIVVGSAAFTESETLANIYADLLEANGYPVTKKLNIGSREVYWPAMKNGEINFLPEYAGTLITFIDKNATATTNTDEERDPAREGAEADQPDRARALARAGHQRLRRDQGNGRQVQAGGDLRPREARVVVTRTRIRATRTV